jgi:hypothetical protein
MRKDDIIDILSKGREVISSLGDFTQRKVGYFSEDGLMISTIANPSHPSFRAKFSTGISSPLYSFGTDDLGIGPGIAVVEEYDTLESAKEGHARWVEKMLTDPPDALLDVSTDEFSEMAAKLNPSGPNAYRIHRKIVNPNLN